MRITFIGIDGEKSWNMLTKASKNQIRAGKRESREKE